MDLLFLRLDDPIWFIALAVLRVLSSTFALLALVDVVKFRRLNPIASTLLISGLLLLCVSQMLGAVGLQQPFAPKPTPWALIANLSALLVCVGIWMRRVVQIRRPS